MLHGQSLPLEMYISNDNRLITGGNEVAGLYDLSIIHKVELQFEEANWFTLLDGGNGPFASEPRSLVAKLIFNDEIVLDSISVNIKGVTSDFLNNSFKKSFSLDLDFIKDQDLMGYDNLNLNCGFLDKSSMREILYYDISRGFAPALKGAFVDLYINGEYWGPYSNIQQIEGTYLSEWFIKNKGTRWRAVSPSGFPDNGSIFGEGESTLNYNGASPSDYNRSYTLKKTNVLDPWNALVNVCDQLNNLPTNLLYDELKYHLDVDKALWFLAQENIFMDDDSYIYKGGMDYYVYWHEATQRIIPLEVDGNTVMPDNYFDWGIFMNEDNPNFPLIHRLLANNEIRQRYLAHVRTILEKHFVPSDMFDRIDTFAALLDQRVQDDPKKIYSYPSYLTGIEDLKNFIANRHTFLINETEINRDRLRVKNMSYSSSNGIMEKPAYGEMVEVRVEIKDEDSLGVKKVRLHYSQDFEGVYEYSNMTDDNGDGVYSGFIPNFPASSYVRFYIEAIANDSNNTCSFFPEGAEHDVFILQVEGKEEISSEIVINELMASNDQTISDEFGEYDDWIELYNTTDETIHLSGYTLSDDVNHLHKWKFPNEAFIAPDEYVLIWADNDEVQGKLHTNFKLSSKGESLYLSNPEGIVTNRVSFDMLLPDESYSRVPNGIGDFIVKAPSFGFNNELDLSLDPLNDNEIYLFPNPSKGEFWVQHGSSSQYYEIYNIQGQLITSGVLKKSNAIGTKMNMNQLHPGLYILKVIMNEDSTSSKFIID